MVQMEEILYFSDSDEESTSEEEEDEEWVPEEEPEASSFIGFAPPLREETGLLEP